MSKRLPEIQEDSAQDSFLDVIANLVGVIIILVMLVGAKATRDVLRDSKAASDKVAVSEPLPTAETVLEKTPDVKIAKQFTEAKSAALKARQEVEQMATRLVRMRQESAELDAERITLAMHRSIVEEDIAKRRARLDADKQKEFDVQRQIVESQIQLDKLMQEQIGLLEGPETVEELESVPTPLAREDDSDAIHLRLKNGLVSVVPFKELMSEVESHGQDIGRRLQTSEEVVETFGPIGGYRLRFEIAKFDDPASIGGPRAGQLTRQTIDYAFEILPTSETIGQDVEMALMPGGSLHQYLTSNHRRSSVVVVWLYTDSFEDFRVLKRSLWEMGFSVATKPLPLGTNIAASPHGTKAAVQ
jgi:hypothetical protein